MSLESQRDKQAKIDKVKSIQVKKSENSDEQVYEKVEPILPKTFIERLANYWYHYKIHTIAGMFLLIILVAFILNIFTTDKFDIRLIIVSEKTFSGSNSFVQEALIGYLPDYDGNGESKIAVTNILLDISGKSDVDPRALEADRAKLLATTSDNQSFLYLLDANSYKELVDIGVVFKDLSEVASNSHILKDKYELKGSKINAKIGLNNMVDDMYLCLVDFDKFDEKAKNKIKVKNEYENQKAFLQKLIELDN